MFGLGKKKKEELSSTEPTAGEEPVEPKKPKVEAILL